MKTTKKNLEKKGVFGEQLKNVIQTIQNNNIDILQVEKEKQFTKKWAAYLSHNRTNTIEN